MLAGRNLRFFTSTTLETVTTYLSSLAAAPRPEEAVLPLLVLIDDLEAPVGPDGWRAALSTLQAVAHEEGCTVSRRREAGARPGDHRPALQDIQELVQGQVVPDTVITLYREGYYNLTTNARDLLEINLRRREDQRSQSMLLEFLGQSLTLRSTTR